MQHEKSDTYVISTGETHSIREFVEEVAQIVGFMISWQGSGQNEKGIDTKTGETLVVVNPLFYRPTEDGLLKGNSNKAKELLGWVPVVSFKELCQMMIEADIKRAKEES